MNRPVYWHFLLVVFAASVAMAGEAEVRDIVRRSTAAEERNWALARKYAFSERTNQRHLNSEGKVESQDVTIHEITLLEGSQYRRLVAHGDRPLTFAEELREQERFAKVNAQRKKESPAQRAQRVGEYDGRPAWQREAWRDLAVHQATDATWQGRTVYRLDLTPRPGFQPRTATGKAMQH